MDMFRTDVKKQTDEIAELLIKKRQDYGAGNITKSIIDPRIAIAVRLNDKIARLVNLVENGNGTNFEPLRDTAIDIAGYGVLLAMYLDGKIVEDEKPEER